MTAVERNFICEDAEAMGFSVGRLHKIGEFFQHAIGASELDGAIVTITRCGRVVLDFVAGWADHAAGMRLTKDTVFPIYSMTKPLTAALVLSLVEEGRIRLADPIADYLPGFAGMEVLADGDNAGRDTRAPRRAPTVQDLLTHTAGLGGGVHATPKLQELYRRADIFPYDHTPAADRQTHKAFVERLAQLPLAWDPGTTWEYSRGYEVLGRLIEVVVGEPLPEIFRKRLFERTGMTRTGFFMAQGDDHCIAPHGQGAAEPAERRVVYRKAPAFISAGSGALSTADDFHRFCTMLAQGGIVGRERVLSESSVCLMLSDHLGPRLHGSGPDYIPGPGYGYGFGVAVRTSDGSGHIPGKPGDVWWLGRGGTNFLISRHDDLIMICMTQKFGQARKYQALVQALTMQAYVGEAPP